MQKNNIQSNQRVMEPGKPEKNSSPVEHGWITTGNLIILAALLVLPVVSLQRISNGLLWGGGYCLLMSGLTYLAYAWDKKQAREKQWRMSEAKLHLMEMLGGWPGALLAQRRLRHKCSKLTYQLVFWLIVGVYQFVALDSLQQWKWVRAAWGQIFK